MKRCFCWRLEAMDELRSIWYMTSLQTNLFVADATRLDLPLPSLPDILTTGLAGAVLLPLFLPVSGADHILLDLARLAPHPHAEPEVVPLFAAGTHMAITVNGVPLAAEAVACPSLVKGRSAGHVRR